MIGSIWHKQKSYIIQLETRALCCGSRQWCSLMCFFQVQLKLPFIKKSISCWMLIVCIFVQIWTRDKTLFWQNQHGISTWQFTCLLIAFFNWTSLKKQIVVINSVLKISASVCIQMSIYPKWLSFQHLAAHWTSKHETWLLIKFANKMPFEWCLILLLERCKIFE